MGATLKILQLIMKTIAENIKYPEFRESYKGIEITGHLIRINDMYYHHSKRVVTEYPYEELPEYLKAAVAEFEKKQAEMDIQIAEFKKNVKAHNALVEWARTNAHQMSRSNQSESEYYFVRHTDGRTYEIRISGHRYPTGSMTDMTLAKIDTTDTCCAKYCDMLGIEY